MVDGGGGAKPAIQPLKNASAADSAVMLARGNASGQRGNLSMHGSKYFVTRKRSYKVNVDNVEASV